MLDRVEGYRVSIQKVGNEEVGSQLVAQESLRALPLEERSREGRLD